MIKFAFLKKELWWQWKIDEKGKVSAYNKYNKNLIKDCYNIQFISLSIPTTFLSLVHIIHKAFPNPFKDINLVFLRTLRACLLIHFTVIILHFKYFVFKFALPNKNRSFLRKDVSYFLNVCFICMSLIAPSTII